MAAFVLYPHPALGVVAKPRPVDAAMIAAGEALMAAAREVQAYGLAAAHLGLIEPVIVVSVSPRLDTRDYRMLLNAEVISVAKETATGAEGSVSMPGIEVDVWRPTWAEIRWTDVDGHQITERFEGFVARVMLHEIEQMNGIFFLRKLSSLKRDMAFRKFKKSPHALRSHT